MEGNKDESNRCIRLAEKCLKLGDTEQALKYLNKAERLFPSTRARDLIDGIHIGAAEARTASSAAPNDAEQSEDTETTTEPAVDDDIPNSDTCGTDVFDDNVPKYTEVQLDAVQKIRRCKDYYEILGLMKDCTDDDLKKSYKKLALKFHPDKNKAPGATEAFKAISNAFSVLSSPVKRKRYDEFGLEELSRVLPRQRRKRFGSDDDDDGCYGYTYGSEGDISAEELFRMFFGDAFTPVRRPPARPPRMARPRPPQPRQQYRPRPQPDNAASFLMQISPLLFMVLLSLVSTLFISDPTYSLVSDSKYSVERQTSRFTVSYYVRPDFDETYAAGSLELSRLERQIEDEFIANLQHSCYRERSYQCSIWSVLWEKVYRSKIADVDELKTHLIDE